MGGGTVGRHALLHHVLDDGTAGGNGIGRGGGDNDEREKRFLSCYDSLLMAPIGDAAGKLTPLESACFHQPSALSSVAIDRACAAGMEIVGCPRCPKPSARPSRCHRHRLLPLVSVMN